MRVPELDKAKLAELVRTTGAFRYSPDELFTLASGLKTPYYFDLRRLNGDAAGISAVAEALYGMIRALGGIRSVGGLESGSISIAAAVSYLSHIKSPLEPLSSFYVRKEPKKYGTRSRIEGILRSPAVVVEDVVTSGRSALRAADAVREAGCECRAIISIIFRGGDTERSRINKSDRFYHILHETDLTGGAPAHSHCHL